jgi:hypothetical protein
MAKIIERNYTMSQITQITYSRLFNLGNYENERLDVVVQLDDDDSPIGCADEARIFVETQHAAFEQARKDEAEREYQAQLARAEAERLKWQQRRAAELPNDDGPDEDDEDDEDGDEAAGFYDEEPES